ncbi:MAG: SNF2-related protein, partial [Alphaproteobacteria bacterium]|nr:SNF2-related protein [Alphaproteobacteria bacterium]
MIKDDVLMAAHQKLSDLRSGILFINQAVKKIQMALALVEEKLDEVDFIIWIAPSGFLATRSYMNEIKKNNRTFRHRIYFYSIESVSVSDEKYLELYNLIHNFKIFCVVDESITIKNTEAGRTQRLLSLSSKFSYRLILSSIPLTQGLIDLYSQIEFLDTRILRMNENQFGHIFMPSSYSNYLVIKQWSRPEDEQRLFEYIKPYVLGYDFGEEIEITHRNQYFELTPREEESYNDEKNLFLQEREQVAFMDVVQNFQRMYTLSQNKLEALRELVKQILARGEKVIIFIKFLDEITFFKESKFFGDVKFVELTGKSNKRKAIKEFERHADIMFCTYGVDKFGLDMQLCNNIIY